MPEPHAPRNDPRAPRNDPYGPYGPHASEDALTTAFKNAAAAGQTGAAPAPVAVIMARGDRVRRRRIAGYAVAACLAVGGTGIAAAAVLPFGGGGTVAPATSPSGSNPDRVSPSARPTAQPTEPGSQQPSATSSTGTGMETRTVQGTPTDTATGHATTTTLPPLGGAAHTTNEHTAPPN